MRPRRRPAVGPLLGERPWKLDVIREPALMRRRRAEIRIAPEQIEVAAWCHELHLQVDELARERGMTLLLMGGQGASLRLASAVQRSSADNDYIVIATAHDIDELMTALLEKLQPHATHRSHFTGAPIQPPPGARLPMRAWRVIVPRTLTGGPNAIVKLEFHLEPALPPHDELAGDVWTAGDPLRARVPKLPFQIALKALTLANPLIGIAPERDDARPRQIYDLDHLYALIDDLARWQEVDDWFRSRHAYECETKNLQEPTPDSGYDEIDAFLTGWADGLGWNLIRSFEGSQVFPDAAVSADGWRARAARVRAAIRLTRARDYTSWQQKKEAEPVQVSAQIEHWLA
jgi:Nucleotidyl transferase AbiEii toxin, Type IV TA system